MTRGRLTDEEWRDAVVLWHFLQMGHDLRPCSAAIGLGSYDLGVATRTAELYQANLFPVLVFSGATSPGTAARFPRGEAVHYREHALSLGVPDSAMLIEPNSTNTGENIEMSRRVLSDNGVRVDSLLLVSKPYMERRAYATCRKVWPEVDIVCASEPVSFDDYMKALGNDYPVIDMLVGDLQRVVEYPKNGFAIEQDVPDDVMESYYRLVRSGFDSRLISET